MKLKTGENGEAVLEDGKPVFVSDDGEEKPVDVAAMAQSLTKANQEAAKYRTELKEAKARLSLFGDLEPAEAKKAVAFRKSMGDDFDPDKAAHRIAELESEKAGLTSQLEERDTKIGDLSATVDTLTFDRAIGESEFVSTKLHPTLRPPNRFKAAFGDNLGRDENGKPIVKDAAGNTIMSEKHPGQPASLDEALPKIVSETDLAPGGASGGGERPGRTAATAIPAGKKFSDLSAAERAAAVRAAGGDLSKLGLPAPPG